MVRNSAEQIFILKIIVEKSVFIFSVIVYLRFTELNLYDSVKLRSPYEVNFFKSIFFQKSFIKMFSDTAYFSSTKDVVLWMGGL